jgi:transposase
MGIVYTGLDVGSHSCHLVAMDKEGITMADKKFLTSEANLIAAVELLPKAVHVHLESSELAGWVRGVLNPRVERVVVSHAKTSAWIAKDPLKHDRLDAFKLADLLRMNRVHEVYYSDDEHRGVFKQLVQHYDELTHEQARLKVKIKSRLRVQGIIARGEAVYHPTHREPWLKQISSLLARETIQQLYGLLDRTQEAQHAARRLLCREAKRYPEINRFMDVPGVGLIGACRFSGYIQTPNRFSNKRKLWRYCRLGIMDRSSDGKPLGRQSLDRTGNGRLKDMTRKGFESAMRTRTDNVFKRTYQQSLLRTHNPMHARLSTQRKLVSILRALWQGGTLYREVTG